MIRHTKARTFSPSLIYVCVPLFNLGEFLAIPMATNITILQIIKNRKFMLSKLTSKFGHVKSARPGINERFSGKGY